MTHFGYVVRWEVSKRWFEDYFNSHDFALAESRFHNLQINLPGSEVQLVQLGHLKTDRVVLGYRAGQ